MRNRDAAAPEETELRPMRILYIIPTLRRGGAEAVLYALLARLDPTVVAPAVVTLLPGGALEPAVRALGISVTTLDVRRNGLKALWTLRCIVRAMQPDIIHGWLVHGNLAARCAQWLGRRPAIPVIWSIHQSLSDWAHESPMTRRLIQWAAWWAKPVTILYCSRRSAEQHERLGYPSHRRFVIPNGFDAERFVPQPAARTAIRSTLRIDPDIPVVGHVARFHPQKGQFAFIEAARRFLQVQGDARFIMAGDDITLGNPVLKHAIAQTGAADRFSLLGPRDDIECIYNACDLVAVTSTTEAFPQVLGEAMACGVPCATTDVGDAGEIVSALGRVVPVDDADAMVVAWEQLLRERRSSGVQCAEQLRRSILERFSIESLVRQYMRLYQHVLTPSTSSLPLSLGTS